MPSKLLFLKDHGRLYRAMAEAGLASLLRKFSESSTPPEMSNFQVETILAPRSPDLIKAYIRTAGGQPKAYRDFIPPHFFPQWGLGFAAEALKHTPYPLARTLNGGCSYQWNAPIPWTEPLHVRAHIDHIDDNGRRAIVHVRIITGTASEPNALEATMQSFIPLASEKGSKGKPRPRVPLTVREVGRLKLTPQLARDFACVTGDINPLHWIPAYARAAGFKNTILHGFATMARAIEGLNRNVMAGRVDEIKGFEARFTRPVVLPARLGLFLGEDNTVFIGDAPGGPSYMSGRYTT
jgi:hypothetical protein